MDDLVTQLNAQPLLVVAAAIVLGMLLGGTRLWGFALGASGVLFVAMGLGHLGVRIPALVGELGIVLFVYAVGLQAGPHFIRTIRRRGWSFLLLAVVTLAAAWLAALVFTRWAGVDAELATGVYAGALTSTPALAASLQMLGDARVSVGFGVAYPLGVIGVMLFVQLLPRLLRVDWQEEIAQARAAEGRPEIEVVWYQVTNPQVDGRTIRDVEAMHMSEAVISRVLDKYVALPAQAETHLGIGQHVRAVGTAGDLARLELLLGPRVTDFKEPRSAISTATLVVSDESVCGQTLREMHFRERYGVTVTRMWRDNFEFVPTGLTTLEFGDEIRIVGDVADCQRVSTLFGQQAERLHETRFLPLGLGIAAGLLLGVLPIPLPGGQSLKLGLAGGPLVAGLLVGHYGRIGPVSFRMPLAARMFMNELGLILFLTSAGLHAGEGFWEVVRSQGWMLLAAAAVITVVPLAISFVVARYAFRWDALHALGAVCGAMTSTPGLGAVTRLANSNAPAAAYVAVYPVALVTVSLLAPLLGSVLRMLNSSGF